MEIDRGCHSGQTPPEIEHSRDSEQHQAPDPFGVCEGDERTAEPDLGYEPVSKRHPIRSVSQLREQAHVTSSQLEQDGDREKPGEDRKIQIKL